jgi:CheY-like chemotaxis protein/nitrogen-specific signal transduction histidine kinase
LLSQMSQEILKQNAELEQHRTNLEKLVVERTRELEVAVHKAMESDRLKTAFLANMSHEIRTPMNAIVGFANLLKDSDLEVDERNEFIDVINANSETLLVLIDDILDLSLIEANQLSIRKDVFSVNEMLDHLVSSYSLMNRKQHLTFRLNNQLHSECLQLNSDKVRIKQILVNLINNAYKFTDEGYIEIGLVNKFDHLAFYVKDSGIGIEEQELANVFERFRKSETSNNTLYRGAGLGLAISKALSLLLGGNMKAESSFGAGSTFFLLLPVSDISNIEPVNAEFFLPKDSVLGSGRNILIVEDEQANYLYARKMLLKLDVTVHWAENGLEAVKLIGSGIPFHIVLMDIKMPVMDGFEATKAIKKANPNQIIIALTAYARPEDRQHFMKAGFDDYLAKPIKPNDFLAVIQKYL